MVKNPNNHLKVICEKLGVDTIEEAVDIINSNRSIENATLLSSEELIAMQKELDILYELIITNQNAFGVQTLVPNKKGGLNIIEINPNKLDKKIKEVSDSEEK